MKTSKDGDGGRREGQKGRRRVGAEEDAVDRKGFSLPEGVGVRPWETGAGGVILKRGAGRAWVDALTEVSWDWGRRRGGSFGQGFRGLYPGGGCECVPRSGAQNHRCEEEGGALLESVDQRGFLVFIRTCCQLSFYPSIYLSIFLVGESRACFDHALSCPLDSCLLALQLSTFPFQRCPHFLLDEVTLLCMHRSQICR